jgi:hypothetical protein
MCLYCGDSDSSVAHSPSRAQFHAVVVNLFSKAAGSVTGNGETLVEHTTCDSRQERFE